MLGGLAVCLIKEEAEDLGAHVLASCSTLISLLHQGFEFMLSLLKLNDDLVSRDICYTCESAWSVGSRLSFSILSAS